MTLYERFIDITARKPSGVMGRRMYRNPRGHMISFRMLLKELNPTEDDLYAEIGCGGGALLDMALTTVKRAWAVDHSPDMVAMARENNAGAIAAGRLDVIRGSAQDLPWADESFTCITNANMFFFVEDPMAMLRECRRVLKPGGGRLAMATVARCLPMEFFRILYRLRLYSNDEMYGMLKEAGFDNISIHSRWGCQICRAVNVEENS